uniref:glucuronosyltransferase n=1 Tax=Panagrolaimus davidi TaxID=227884 RepID=A0A914PMR5_9BILA
MEIQNFFVVILLFLAFSNAEIEKKNIKILQVMPFIAYSHVKFQGHLADLLVADGYDVHLAIHEMRPITAVGSNLAKIIKFHTSVAKQENAQNPIKAVFQNKTAYDDHACILFWRSLGHVCKEVLQNETYKSMLKFENFDLGIGQDPCAFVLFKELGIKATIMAGPMPLMDDVEYVHGIPIQRSYNNFIFNGYINAPYLTFMQRLGATLEILTKYIGYGSPTNFEMQKVLDDSFGKGKYNLEEAMQDVSLIFSNSHELIDIARPTMAKVIPIGGLAMIPPKALTEVN